MKRPFPPATFARHVLAVLALAFVSVSAAQAAEVFARLKVVEPAGKKFRVTTGGHIHVENWYLPETRLEVAGGQWSAWIDMTKWPLHGRLDRSGGVAEWPSMRLQLQRLDDEGPIRGCTLAVELADRPDPQAVVIAFQEKGGGDAVEFLVPHPLRDKKGEFETGSQMTARHHAWAKEASRGRAPALKKFDVVTSVWGHYDPLLSRQTLDTLKLLGFNVSGGVPDAVLRESGMRTYTATWHLVADPEESAAQWNKDEGRRIAQAVQSPDDRWRYERMAHYVIADEIQTMDFRNVDPAKLNRWFRDYLRSKGETDQSLGRPIESIEYPAKAMYEKSLPRGADLATRKAMYYAGKFGQWWSVKQLRYTSDLVHRSFASLPGGMKTETLPSDHSFFNAWGPPACGMGYRGLDFFEIGAQEAVDIVSAEDWMGLNHMYGPSSTWTGAQALGYLSAIYRSGIGERKVDLRALITPSDDGYLRLKAYAALGQGAKSFFFWTFGPTYIGTENYWSDLRSEYEGIARFTRALEKAEPILADARPVRDPVAILYSVSHDLWHTDDPACFVENRLTWAALRHAGIQPDFLREEDVEAGRLANYKVLYLNGQCLTRKAAARIDDWVRGGGVVCLSAGAASRDEFYEPALPSFAAAVWPQDAAAKIVQEKGHRYNERVDLPKIKPLAKVKVLPEDRAESLPAIGYRLNLKPLEKDSQPLARFEDGMLAGARARHGKGEVFGLGVLPGLAYSPFKAGQTTLDEVWPELPRRVIAGPLASLLGSSQPGPVAKADAAVVECDLLSGPRGSALVLVNHTYRPIAKLRVTIPSLHPVSQATSTEGVRVDVKAVDGKTLVELPLEWTDIVLLPK
jgi:hypothetical protein